MPTPKIRIRFSHLLEPWFKRMFDAGMHDEVKEAYPETDAAMAKTERCEQEWRKIEPMVMRAMQAVLGLEFRQPEIDVHTVYTNGRSISDPMIVSLGRCNPVQFTSRLMHELLHRLLCDNTKAVDVRSTWMEMFPDSEHMTRVHVVLHAVLQHLYIDILHDEKRLSDDIAVCGHSPAYKRSWEIVQERGYANIIRDFKNYYDA